MEVKWQVNMRKESFPSIEPEGYDSNYNLPENVKAVPFEEAKMVAMSYLIAQIAYVNSCTEEMLLNYLNDKQQQSIN